MCFGLSLCGIVGNGDVCLPVVQGWRWVLCVRRVMFYAGRVSFFALETCLVFVKCYVLNSCRFYRCSKGKIICPSSMFCCPSSIFHITGCYILCTHRRQRALRRLQAERQRRARPKGSPLTACLLQWYPSPFNRVERPVYIWMTKVRRTMCLND